MTKVIYNSNNASKAFDELDEGTYFDYEGSLYLLVDEYRGIVYDFEDESSFKWCDEFDADTKVLPIASNRVTIKVD